jgi:Ca2+-binding RTX toxin-like protein
MFQYRIDWIGNGNSFQVVSGINGIIVTYVYQTDGNFTPTVTAVDSADNASEPAAIPQQVGIVTVDMESDPVTSGETDLVIGGIPGNDVITITPADTTGQLLSVNINGVVQPNGRFAPTGHILIYGDGGNDLIQLVAGANAGQVVPVAIPALLFAGAESCTRSAAGSSANNVLVGGVGNNTLIGGEGRDILIGGAGAVTLRAGSGGDLLIGGTTLYDNNVTALLALMDEWQRTDISYQQRVQDPSVGGIGASNGTTLLDSLTLTADDASDDLIGGSNADWFWLMDLPTFADIVSGYTPGEAVAFLRD